MSQPKRYRLLKDTIRSMNWVDHICPAGTIYQSVSSERYAAINGGWILSAEFVENNPEWFAVVEDENSSREFLYQYGSDFRKKWYDLSNKIIDDYSKSVWEDIAANKKKITEQEALEREEKAFNAARYVTPDPQGAPTTFYTYPKLSDYKNSQKK